MFCAILSDAFHGVERGESMICQRSLLETLLLVVLVSLTLGQTETETDLNSTWFSFLLDLKNLRVGVQIGRGCFLWVSIGKGPVIFTLFCLSQAFRQFVVVLCEIDKGYTEVSRHMEVELSLSLHCC